MLVVKCGNLFVNITQYTHFPMTKQVNKLQVAQLPENHGESESNSAPKLWQRKPPSSAIAVFWKKIQLACINNARVTTYIIQLSRDPEFPYLSSRWLDRLVVFLRRVPVTQDW